MAKKTATRLYRTDELNDDGTVKRSHLVRTSHPNSADAHVARKLVRSRVATQEDLRELRSLDEEIPNGESPNLTVRVEVTPEAARAIAEGKAVAVQTGEGKLDGLRILPADEQAGIQMPLAEELAPLVSGPEAA